ncbi:sulfur carrier protein ThiS [Porticoccus sp. W117]|uniref:sulfur carrier protein ThiS n=1 Tax=Porticoccus sp. W117 TaxID=3054777 RepID=UPI0025997BF5|nr:sulfur carrier protein ThiS [Porticoccus sp. W117]MDM3872422.1 sulfur carrier protein ThiS [Porticoccus sp. W117]
MKISINGESRQFAEDIPLVELLSQYGAVEPYVVAVNTEFVPKPNYGQVALKDGDLIDVVQPLQGG